MILHGDCLARLREMPANSVDSVVTDPPYGLSFMGKKWDYDVPSVGVWREVLRVLKPGGHALIACGTRTQHRMVVNIEDAGFEIRDVVTWLYGQGFPKSLDISKAIDKAAGAEREVIGPRKYTDGTTGHYSPMHEGYERPMTKAMVESGAPKLDTAPSTPAAKQWQGFGTALKPACEFWTLARKPLEGTVAANVLKHGTGGLNIDGCRIKVDASDPNQRGPARDAGSVPFDGGFSRTERPATLTQGRFPANLILDEEAAAALDEQSGHLAGPGNKLTRAKHHDSASMFGMGGGAPTVIHDRGGGASRFFYVAKVSPSERNAGLEGMPDQVLARSNGAKSGNNDERAEYNAEAKSGYDKRISTKNHHPTVKPVKLMRYLCRLVTPPGGLVLDPFAGSGSTGVAALMEGFRFVGIEREAEYVAIAERRLESTPVPQEVLL